MINGIFIDETFAKMQESNFQFHLTGSRFFGYFRENSDYDFFTEVKPSITAYLVSLGFSLIGKKECHYWDRLTEAVYRKGDIDIQIVADVLAKLEVQRRLKNQDAFKGINYKLYRTKIWNRYIDDYFEQKKPFTHKSSVLEIIQNLVDNPTPVRGNEDTAQSVHKDVIKMVLEELKNKPFSSLYFEGYKAYITNKGTKSNAQWQAGFDAAKKDLKLFSNSLFINFSDYHSRLRILSSTLTQAQIQLGARSLIDDLASELEKLL